MLVTIAHRLFDVIATKMAVLRADLQTIFCNENADRRKLLLADILNLGHFDEDDDFRTAILLDIYHDNLLFAVKHGFPWGQVCSYFKLIERLLSNVKGKVLA